AVYSDYREALARPDVDLVSVCLPPSLHAETAVAALQAGKHVLLEKPMAPSLAECDAILQAAAQAGKMVSVVSQNRFQTSMIRLKEVLDSGLAGRVVHGAVNSYWWRGQSYYDLWWRGTWESEGGGCTINHAVHHADLLLWMMGMPQRVFSFFANLNHGNSETEDFSTSLLSYAGGTVAQLTASLVHHGEEQEMIFQGEKARVSFPWKVKASLSRDNGFPENDPQTEAALQQLYESTASLTREGHPAQIENMLDSIDQQTEPLVDGAAGRRTVELITGIYKSACSGAVVDFPIDPQDPFYRGQTMLPLLPRFNRKRRSVSDFKSDSITLGRQA
ncbi:MAG: gfo/Idh/MocA family oxidoreductase, partial [Spirochaetaceae bacterium]